MADSDRLAGQPCWLAGIGPYGDVATLSAMITGGKPPESRHKFIGCENQAEAWDERGWLLNKGIRIAGYDKIWSGAVAVIDADAELKRPLPVPLIGLVREQVIQLWQQLLPADIEGLPILINCPSRRETCSRLFWFIALAPLLRSI